MKIVTIGGGTGQFTLLSALKNISDIEITAVVSMVDSGGSTGRLRDEYGILPPGDILKCLIALSPYNDARDILHSRFIKNKKLAGHNAGNFLLTFLTQYLSNDFPSAVEALGEILKIKGQVLPVTLDKATLVAELENGEFVYSESVIDVGRDRLSKIKKTFLVPHGGKLQVYPKVIEEIMQADFVIVGPGDLFSSIIPNFLVNGVVQAIKQTNAKLIYILNVMTKFGETDGYTAKKFVETLESYKQRPIDIIIANSKIPDSEVLQKYAKENSQPVVFDLQDQISERKIILEDLISDSDIVRHDINKLKNVLHEILCE